MKTPVKGVVRLQGGPPLSFIDYRDDIFSQRVSERLPGKSKFLGT